MHKSQFLFYVRLLAAPVLLVILGIILLASPDSAASLLVRILGWILIVISACLAGWAIAVPGGLTGKVLGAVLFGLGGIWMVTHPLGLAAWLGRLVGLVLMLQGLQDILYYRARQGSLLLPLLTAVIGVVLVVLPMTTSRVVFRVIGVIVVLIGGFLLYDRLRRRKDGWGPDEPQDPNIIDAL